ncbi:hypothetical protein K438DRAFT_1781006 [Mycena galopus ATCC 62051]|nr:hypothetical protein K438DRAFT_1781006 [Mycena galopus ATCC 62051]
MSMDAEENSEGKYCLEGNFIESKIGSKTVGQGRECLRAYQWPGREKHTESVTDVGGPRRRWNIVDAPSNEPSFAFIGNSRGSVDFFDGPGFQGSRFDAINQRQREQLVCTVTVCVTGRLDSPASRRTLSYKTVGVTNENDQNISHEIRKA